jgi:hypothetical protein
MELNAFRERVRKLKEEHPEWGRARIANALDVHPSRVKRALAWIEKHGPEDAGDQEWMNAPMGKPVEEIKKDMGQETATITTKSLKIKTLEDLLAASDVDMEVWEVERHIINSWEVTMGGKKTGTGVPATYTNYQVKAWLRKKNHKSPEIMMENLVDRLRTFAPDYTPMQYQEVTDPHLLELCLYDHHFGMLAWRHETRQDYDIKIAERFYLRAVQDLLQKVKDFNIEEILIPFGQDFFHLNDPTATTPKSKNRLDCDCRFAKVFEAGKMAVIRAIDLCRQVAPVSVLWVPGNHDPESSYYLAQVLDALHMYDPNVSVNCAPNSRKHYKYGRNFIGYTHGDAEAMRDLPRIFMDEYTKDWAEANYREIHVGHIHKKKKMDFISTESFGSTSIRVIPSLCSTDAWHYQQGYVGKDRAAQSFLWHKTEGLIGSYLTHVLDEE